MRKDKDHDLRYGTGPPAEFRRVAMRRLSHRSGQQQHLLQWLQALGAQEMQWATSNVLGSSGAYSHGRYLQACDKGCEVLCI